MRILHYALGFPPYRTGGLTKFCMDLMIEQNRDGHQIALMWPGQMGFISKNILIRDRGIWKNDRDGVDTGDYGVAIRSFEVINPLPISYDEGIKDFQLFKQYGDKKPYAEFLQSCKPDIIHVHTLMGLHKSFLDAAREAGIRLVFSAHDFFPACPKVTMFRCGKLCDSIQSYKECGICNTTALEIKKIQILQSPLYRGMKESYLVKKLRKHHRDNYLSESPVDEDAAPVGMADDYRSLRFHYGSMLQMMDVIHYNSSVTKEAYESVFDQISFKRNVVVSITHSDIADHKRKKRFTSDTLRLRYLGPQGGAKGFFFSGRHLINYGVRDRISA